MILVQSAQSPSYNEINAKLDMIGLQKFKNNTNHGLNHLFIIISEVKCHYERYTLSVREI